MDAATLKTQIHKPVKEIATTDLDKMKKGALTISSVLTQAAQADAKKAAEAAKAATT